MHTAGWHRGSLGSVNATAGEWGTTRVCSLWFRFAVHFTLVVHNCSVLMSLAVLATGRVHSFGLVLGAWAWALSLTLGSFGGGGGGRLDSRAAKRLRPSFPSQVMASPRLFDAVDWTDPRD